MSRFWLLYFIIYFDLMESKMCFVVWKNLHVCPTNFFQANVRITRYFGRREFIITQRQKISDGKISAPGWMKFLSIFFFSVFMKWVKYTDSYMTIPQYPLTYKVK